MVGDARERALRAIGYGLHVATSSDGEHRFGWAATWLTQCSFDPPAVALAAGSGTARTAMVERSGVFAVNVMARDDRALVARFFKPVEETGDDLDGLAFTLGSTGCPLLEDALGAFECRVRERVRGGDHELFVGDVVDAVWRRDGTPLTLWDTGLDYGGLEDTS